ncbi:MAG: glycoside hydrolase family 3 protein [Epsilonproteobacteria bacterium]|nr:glycoside hydrolase family 3 protein [Campylobacterota bacterium]
MKIKIFLLLISFVSLFAKNIPIESMISQMIVVGFSGVKPGDKWIEQIKRDVRGDKIGGIYIAKENIRNFGQIARVVKYLQEANKKPLLVLTRPNNYVQFTKANINFNLDDAANANKTFYTNLKRAGINMILWPNADLYLNPSLGNQIDMSISYLAYVIKTIKNKKLTPIIGHFPGKITNQRNWNFTELKPYFELIKYGKIQAVIMDDSVNRKLDSTNIATFSNKIIHNILKEKLKFKGLIFSADLKSRKIYTKYNFKNIVIKAVNAGNDILFFSSYFANSTNVPKEVRAIILEALNEGKIKKEQIRNSYEKIIKFKKRLRK